jgi:Fur family peroxide stress response transcriptional regulator
MNCLQAMSEKMQKNRVEEFRLRCREKGVRFTSQRRVVLQTVLQLNSHPTADEIYSSHTVRRAGISRATVYRTLENLVQSGAIIKIGHAGNAIRYDGRIELHHHLVCFQCNAVTDVANAGLDAIPIPDTSAFGFIVKDLRVQLSGLCRHCLKDRQKA